LIWHKEETHILLQQMVISQYHVVGGQVVGVLMKKQVYA
jgi:hypothetical protein